MNEQPPRKPMSGWAVTLLVVLAILVLGFGVCVRTLAAVI